MVLKRLEIFGFKSFADRTTVRFEPGITGIVGPNGCGKSNISDAVRWVLGEQSARSLRGSSMEDVIFAGTAGRPPLHVAEVTLTFDNADKRFPLDFAEVSIGRRLFRDGESEYLLNGERVRLKDLQDLLSDAALGRRNHTIMEQGKIDKLLVAKPEDRRTLFEEAAGIAKYRARRVEAVRRLDATRESLARVEDLLAEIERQRDSLERAARKARRYLERRERLKTLDLSLAARRRDALKAAIEEARRAVAAAEAERSAAEAEAARAAAEREAARAALEAAEARCRETATTAEGARDRLLEARAATDRLAAAAEADRAAAGRLAEEADRFRRKAEEADTALQEVVRALAEIEAEAVRRRGEAEAAAADLAAADEARRAAEERRRAEERTAREAAEEAAARTRAAGEAAAALLEAARRREVEAEERLEEARRAVEAISVEVARLEGAAEGAGPAEETCALSESPGCRIAEAARRRAEERRCAVEAARLAAERRAVLAEALRRAEEERSAARWETERAEEARAEVERRAAAEAAAASKDRAALIDAARAAADAARHRWEGAFARWNDLRIALERTEGRRRAKEEEAGALRVLGEDHRASVGRLEAEAAAARARADEAAAAAEAHRAGLADLEAAHAAARAAHQAAEAGRAGAAARARAAEDGGSAAEAALRRAGDALHAASLAAAENEGRWNGLVERLRDRWGTEIEALDPAAFPPIEDEAAAEAEAADIRRLIDGMGNVNFEAAEELAEAERRSAFYRAQRDDLVRAETDLREVVEKIDAHTDAVFRETFAAVANNFRLLFRRLFEGGEADILLTDPDRPLESGVEIVAMPPGKKPQSITLLSGGERTMTAIAILFSVFLVRPSPFSILDELDAPLDEANVERFGRLLREFSKKTQFIVVTHNRRTMELASTLYGLTMQERGVSKVISVRLDEAVAAAS